MTGLKPIEYFNFLYIGEKVASGKRISSVEKAIRRKFEIGPLKPLRSDNFIKKMRGDGNSRPNVARPKTHSKFQFKPNNNA